MAKMTNIPDSEMYEKNVSLEKVEKVEPDPCFKGGLLDLTGASQSEAKGSLPLLEPSKQCCPTRISGDAAKFEICQGRSKTFHMTP